MKLKYSSQGPIDSPSNKPGARKQSTDISKQRTDLSTQARVVQNRIVILQEKWEKLNDLLSVRKTRLEESIQSQKVRLSRKLTCTVEIVIG